MKRLAHRVGVLSVVGLVTPVVGQQPVLIESVTVVSPHLTGPIPDVSILIRDGHIVALGPIEDLEVPANIERIDGSGKWVIPGLIEFHTHSAGAADRSRALSLGVTTAQLIGGSGSPIPFEQRAALADEPSPRIVRVQAGFGQSRGAPGSPEEGIAGIERMRAEGARRVKIWHDDALLWYPPDRAYSTIAPATLQAMVARAHDLDMEVVVHAWKLDLFVMALEAGVDRFIHPVADRIVPEPVLDRLGKSHMRWTTTLTVLLAYADRDDYRRRILGDPRLVRATSSANLSTIADPEFAERRYAAWPVMRERRALYRETVLANTRNALANGVELVIGSDALIGVGTHLELEQLAEAGLTPIELLAAATINGARALGFGEDLGSIEVGKVADLVLLNTNPLEDVRNLRDTFLVVKAGHVYDPAELRSFGN